MRKKSVLLGVAAATMLMTAGCQSKYEKIEAPGAIVESAAEEQKAGISENKAELTTESAPAMEARDEDEAYAAMYAHIMRSRDDMLTYYN